MHVGTTHASGDHLHLPSLLAPDTEARQQKVRREMQHPSSFEISRYNNCNIRLRTIKHLKHASKTLAKTPENT
jgi:hypothetical protein